MTKQLNLLNNNTAYPLKLPVEISTIIEISDPVYTFCEVMDCIDLRKYLAAPESRTGRKRYNSEILLKVILFAFMENIFAEINGYIFSEEKVDLAHIYIDGTKLVANANKNSWVWKRNMVLSCLLFGFV